MNARKPLAVRVQEAIDAGKLWRAKELLQGRIASSGYDPEVLEQLGFVLLRMGDTIEAGRIFFVAGVRTEDSAAPIQVFLNRFGRDPWHLFAALPRCVRRASFDSLPQIVQEEFRQRELARFFEERVRYRKRQEAPAPLLTGAGCIAVAFVLMALACVGAFQVANWILR